MILSQGDDPMIFLSQKLFTTTQYSISLALPLNIRFNCLEQQWNVSLPVCSLQFVTWHYVGYLNATGEREKFQKDKKRLPTF